MDKNDCLKQMEQYFDLKTDILWLKKPDFLMKSRIFYYNNNLKQIDEIKILTVSSRNTEDDILFHVYFIRAEFETLFNGYFKVVPMSSRATKMFEGVSKICNDLGEYMYYVYQNSLFLKIYFATGSTKNALEHCNSTKEDLFNYKKYKEDMYLEISSYTQEEFSELLLNRNLAMKYVSNFIKLNSKCSEVVKMFLINMLSSTYKNNICIINNAYDIKHLILVDTQNIRVKNYPDLSVYHLIDNAVKNNAFVLIRLNDDFKGGGK